MRRIIAIAAFATTIPAANWMIGNVGECIPNGPCIIPVGFGLHAPSGVLMVGVALVLRDLVHRAYGAKAALAAVLVGVALSFFTATPELAIASALAFLMSEMVDFVAFSALVKRSLAAAVLVSGIVGAAMDSAAFLWLAFGSLDFIAGQIVGKIWFSAAASLLLLARMIKQADGVE